MKQIKNYIVSTIQTHLEWLAAERERNSTEAWEKEQKRRRASLEMDERK